MCVCVRACVRSHFRFRCSPSVQRLSVANVAVATCLRLGVPEEALDLISDPVKYGVFPSPFTTNKLMLEFANRGDVDSTWENQLYWMSSGVL